MGYVVTKTVIDNSVNACEQTRKSGDIEADIDNLVNIEQIRIRGDDKEALR